MSPTVLLADDQPPIRAAGGALMSNAEGITVVGEAINGLDAVERVRELRPDVPGLLPYRGCIT